MNLVTVDVEAERPYQIVIGHCARTLLPEYLDGATRVAVIHPPEVAHQVADLTSMMESGVVSIEVPSGEGAKTAAVLNDCWERLAAAEFTRNDAVIGFGGGAATDLAGFVASSWLRGVRYVAVPTTVLAMVDAAVGGKTGINLAAGKNLVGAFYEPYAVLCDLGYAKTLPAAEIRSGLAEVVKAGFIADPAILSLIEDDPQAALDPNGPVLPVLVQRAVAVKAAVVAADLRERTSVGNDLGRELLNYGHTLGHAIERHRGYTWRHGEAISVGMCFVAELARHLAVLDAATADRHAAVLGSLGLPTRYQTGAWPALREAMNLDKKTRGAALRFVILDALASGRILLAPDEADLITAYEAITSA